MRIALGVEYDGSSFRGWQTQPGGGTVQDVLETALSRIAGGQPVSCAPAGRMQECMQRVRLSILILQRNAP